MAILLPCPSTAYYVFIEYPFKLEAMSSQLHGHPPALVLYCDI